MLNFVNVRPNTKEPFLVNADTLSIIIQKHSDKSAFTPTPTLSFYDQTLGNQLWIDSTKNNLDAGTILGALNAAGANLQAIPLIDADKNEHGVAYVNPKAFLALITSAPFTPADNPNPHTNILLDIAGYGRLDSDHLPVSFVEDFMQTVADTSKTLVTIQPDVASARFAHPGYVTLDAAKVTSIRPNGFDIDVALQDGITGMSRIDFIMKRDQGPSALTSHNYANALWKRAERLKVKGLEDKDKMAPVLQEIFDRADKKVARARDTLKEALITTITNQNPGLVEIKAERGLYYVAPTEISSAHCHGTYLSMQFRSADRNYRDSLTIQYETPEKALREITRLQNIMSGGPSADINKPTMNLKRMRSIVEQGKTPKAP